MTEFEKMQRAKMYIDKLANGIDPLTDTEIMCDSTLNNVRISRCFNRFWYRQSLLHTLFTIEDLYGLKITELDGELCLHLDKDMGTDYLTMFDMVTTWKEQKDI